MHGPDWNNEPGSVDFYLHVEAVNTNNDNPLSHNPIHVCVTVTLLEQVPVEKWDRVTP